jgi:hypothetical protein
VAVLAPLTFLTDVVQAFAPQAPPDPSQQLENFADQL